MESETATFWNRIGTVGGLLCLASALVMLPVGVSVVRAGDEAEPLMSVDPSLVVHETDGIGLTLTQPVVEPAVAAANAVESVQPGRNAEEVQPGVIVLNTRGYNYGPAPAAIDPAAMEQESKTLETP